MKTGFHLDAATLEGFLAGSLPRRRDRRIAWHLTSCQSCRDKLLQHPQGEALLDKIMAAQPREEEANTQPSYEAIIGRSYGMLIDREIEMRQDREKAHHLCAELLRHPPARRRVLIDHVRQYQSWGLCEHLLGLCSRSRDDGGEERIEWAQLAIAITEKLPAAELGASLLNDLRARSWAQLGDAQRMVGNCAAATIALQTAQQLLKQGTGDPLEKARVLRMLASLHLDQGSFDEADPLLAVAQRLYRRLGENQQLGRTLLERARIHRHHDRPPATIATLREALELIDPSREPRLWERATLSLAEDYSLAGRFMEARALLRDGRARFATAVDRPRYLWIKARVDLGLGQVENGLRGMIEARDGFAAVDQPRKAAAVGLELARSYAQRNMADELYRLVCDLVPLFQAMGPHPGPLAATALLHQAIEVKSLPVARIEELQRHLAGDSTSG